MVLKVSFLVLFFLVAFVTFIIGYNSELNDNIHGVVEKVYYSDKQNSGVFGNEKKHSISFAPVTFYRKIQVGDSIIKNRGEHSYELIKKKTGEVIRSK